jgi:hypothetical protein
MSEETFDDDILMLSDGVLCEISLSTINEVLGDNIKNIINSRKGISHTI